MSIALAEPAWLLLLLTVPVLGLVLFRLATTLRRVRRVVAIVLRGALVAAIALLLARTSTVRETDRVAVVAVVDASESVARFGTAGDNERGEPVPFAQAAERFLRRLDTSRGPDDLLGVVAFGGRSVALATPSAASIEDRVAISELPGGTDIAGALQLAAGLIPPDASGRIVLMTDGNETAGDAAEAAERSINAAGGTIRVDAVPIAYAVGGETIVESVSAPASAPEGSVVPVRVELATTQGSTGVLRLFADDRQVVLPGDETGGGLRLRLGPGRHVVVRDVPLEPGRITRFRAVYEPDAAGDGFRGDAQLDNNAAEGFTLSPGAGAMLIVDGSSDGTSPSSSNLAAAMADGTTDVRVVPASSMPRDLLSLQDYDLVVLNDVPADALSEEAQRALAAHIAEVGGGLIMVGGRSSFGAGGWAGTPIEPLLPVHLDLAERMIERRTAIVFVLDRSGSMGSSVGGTFRTQQEIANAAAAGAAATLGKHDLVGVVAFSSEARWVVDLDENDNPTATAEAINAIASGGGTNLVPGLMLATEALAPVEAAVKHVIVLSDGRSRGSEDLPAMAERMAELGINVSTISVGDGSDAETMFQIAERGGGVHYAVTNPSVLPRVFVRAVRTVRDPLIKEGEITPVQLAGSVASPVPRGLSGWPTLTGVVLTRFRSDPTVVNILATAEDEPILAHWNAELGRVGVFTSDAGEWASSWLRWPGFDAFWTQFARAMSRPAGENGLELSTEISGGQLWVRLFALDDDGGAVDGLDARAVIYGPNGQEVPVQLEQVGPGQYEAVAPADEQGTYIAVVRPSVNGSAMPPVLSGATNASSLEYQSLEPNTALVRRIVEIGGGRVLDINDPLAGSLFDRSGVEPRRAESLLLRPLLIAAIALFLLDIAARRIAWDRFLNERSVAVRTAGTAERDRSELHARVRRVRTQVGATALGEEAAAAVADEARRRRSESRAASAPQPSPASDAAREPRPGGAVVEEASADAEPKENEPSGLLAAKKRARDRFGSS
ncbi:MAG: VWA domain-containing protein [Phycisphaerales bacterium]